MNTKLNCKMCKADFFVYPYRKETALYCSKECRRKSQGLQLRGAKCHFYKTGRFKNLLGYVLFSDGKKQVYEHRFVMEKSLGRELIKGEDVHHINGDKEDNRIENLVLLTHSEHLKLHTTRRWREDGGIYAI